MISNMPMYNLLSQCLGRGWGTGNTTSASATDSVIWRLVDGEHLAGTFITVVNYNSQHMAGYFEKYQLERARDIILARLKDVEDKYKECYSKLPEDKKKGIPSSVTLTLSENSLNTQYEGISGHQHKPITRYYLRVIFMASVS